MESKTFDYEVGGLHFCVIRYIDIYGHSDIRIEVEEDYKYRNADREEVNYLFNSLMETMRISDMIEELK